MSVDLNPTCLVAKRFLEDLKINGKSKRTQQSYCRAVRKFTEFLGHSPELATEDQLRNYLLHIVCVSCGDRQPSDRDGQVS